MRCSRNDEGCRCLPLALAWRHASAKCKHGDYHVRSYATKNAHHAPPFPARLPDRPRRHRAGDAAAANRGPRKPTRYGHAPGTSRRRRRTSSICTWPGRRRISICSITSRSWCGIAARIAPNRSCVADGSRSPAACRSCSALRSVSPSMADAGRGSPERSSTSRRLPTNCASSSRCTPSNSITPRPNCLLFTGSPQFGRPSMGSWVTYGLGSESQDLPGFIALVSSGTFPSAGNSDWNNGFLPSVYQGVQCRSQGDPVLYVSNPNGMNAGMRRLSLDALRDLNELQAAELGSPETRTRIAQYELAFRMQTAVPEVMDITREPQRRHRRLWRPARRRQLRQQLLAGPPADRARRPLRPTSRLGLGLPRHRRRRGHQDRPADQVPHDGPGHHRPDSRPEASRLAGRNASSSGRASSAAARSAKAAPPTARTWAAIIIRSRSRSSRAAAASSPARPTAPAMSSASTSAKIRSIRTICKRRSCICWAWSTHG